MSRDRPLVQLEPTEARLDLRSKRVNLGATDFLVVLPELGPVTVVSANRCATLRASGTRARSDTKLSRAHLGDHAELSLSPEQWVTALSVNESAEGERRGSLQFFDPHGDFILQLMADSEDGAVALHALSDAFASHEAPPHAGVTPLAPRADAKGDVDIDRLRALWDDAQTSDDFRALLAAFRLSELQAIQLLGTEMAFPVSMGAVRGLLALAADLEVPVAVVVENRGVTHRCTGAVSSMRRTGADWWLDGRHFGLNLRSDLFGSAWIVRRPAMLRAACLELYDSLGERVVRIEAGKGDEARVAWAILIGAHSEGSA